jgi:hypothetical protein
MIVPRRSTAFVSTQPLPEVHPPASAFMPPAPIDFSPITRFVGQLAEEEQARNDQTALIEADAKLAKATDLLLYDPDTGALSRRGKDAAAAADKADEGWRKAVDEIDMHLGNDRQRMKFRGIAAQRTADFNHAATLHVARETEAWKRDAADANLTEEFNLVVKNYQDPGRVEKGIQRMRAVLDLSAETTGEAPEVTRVKTETLLSRTHTAVIGKILSENGGYARAQSYYDRVKDSVVGDDAARIEKALRTGKVMGDAQANADRIMSTPAITRADAFEQARKLADPETRDETEKRLDTEFRRRDAADQDMRVTRFQTASDIVESGRRPPAPLWSVLTLGERNALDERLRQVTAGVDAVTDLKLYYQLKLKAADPDSRREFVKENLLQYRHRLGESEFKELVRAQTSLMNGGPDEETTGYMTVAAKVNDALAEAKIKSDSKEGISLRRFVDREILSYKQSTGRKEVPAPELQQIIDRGIVKKVFIDQPGFDFIDAQRRVGLVSDDERGRAYVKQNDIPAAERNDLIQRMRRAGTRVTDAKVGRAYAQLLLGDADAALRIIQEP